MLLGHFSFVSGQRDVSQNPLNNSILHPNHTHSFIFLLGNGHKVLVELPGELDIVPLDDVAPADLLHNLLPVD